MARKVIDPKTGFIQFIPTEDEKKLKAIEKENKSLKEENEALAKQLKAFEERLEKAGI